MIQEWPLEEYNPTMNQDYIAIGIAFKLKGMEIHNDEIYKYL